MSKCMCGQLFASCSWWWLCYLFINLFNFIQLIKYFIFINFIFHICNKCFFPFMFIIVSQVSAEALENSLHSLSLVREESGLAKRIGLLWSAIYWVSPRLEGTESVCWVYSSKRVCFGYQNKDQLIRQILFVGIIGWLS